MKPSRKQTFRTVAQWPTNVRLALLAITVFICCAIIGAPVIGSVERSNSHMAAAAVAAKAGHSSRARAASVALQSENGPDKKEQFNERPSTQDFYEIPYAGPKVPVGIPGKSLKPGGPHATFSAVTVEEVEPNNTAATAQALGVTSARIRGNLFPNGDVDFYSFTAAAGNRVYAATMTSWSAGSSTDSQITLIGSDGTTVIEFDDDNGSFAGFSSSIAGAMIPSTGTYYLKVNDFTAGTTSERPYELWLQVQSGAPTPEVEGNDTPATANPLPASGWVSGTRNPAAATEQDWYSMTLAAGDTVYLGLDLDPERDGVVWNGRLGIALFGDAGNQILVVDDSGASETPNPTIPSEALFMTVKDAGTYYAFVDSASAAVGGPTATYNLNVTVLPRVPVGVNCTTYTSADVPKTIGPSAGLVSSTITIPGNPRIASMRVFIDLTHALMADLDVHLRSPAGNDNGLFTDIGASATGGQTMMSLGLDDYAGIPFAYTVVKGLILKPELSYRLGWFNGEDAGGTWTLDIRDDTTNASGGTLTGWRIEICEEPPPPLCGGGGAQQTVYSTDFETDAGGFTHSGTADEWERGLPSFAPITTCNSGVNCWKTDLDNTYDVSSNQDLFSPNIDLTTFLGPITLTWAQRYQMESASFDHMFVEVQEVGGGGATRKLFEWLDATMTNTVGSPSTTINESAGWGLFNRDISDFAGKIIRVRFHLDSDSSVNFAGLAIDDVSVKACVPSVSCTLTCPANVTQTNDPDQCGAAVTYPAPTTTGNCGTVTCSPASGSVFPVGTTTVTCTATGGGDQPAAPSGNQGSSCSFTVTVTDDQPPTITCPANITKPNDPNQCGAVVIYPPPIITDNCPGEFTATCTPASGSFFPVGTTTVTCQVDGFGGGKKPSGGKTSPSPLGKQPPGCSTITESSSQAIEDLNSVSCNDGFGHTDNSYWRAFTLSSFGIGGAWDVQSVDIGVELASAGVGGAPSGGKTGFSKNVSHASKGGKAPAGVGQPLTIRLWTSSMPFPTGYPGSLTMIGSTSTTVADQADTIINIPVTGTAPAGSQLVVEVFTPDGTSAGNLFFIGSNSAAETGPSYLSAADCGITTPTTTAALGFPSMHIVMNVNGCEQLTGTGPTCTFTVTVNDTQPPTITCPANIFVAAAASCPPATSRTVNYTVTATDNCPGVTVVCVPPSGSIFPVGTTTVTCTATDASGNTATCSFTVTVFSACLVDESNSGNVVLFNAQTGEYRFCCSGQLLATGTGVLTIRGCIGSITDQKGSRKVTIGFDFSAFGVGRGTASLFLNGSTEPKCRITDQSMAGNVCTCPTVAPPPDAGTKK
jgi:subtilisin-like proprotein convertase family protein